MSQTFYPMNKLYVTSGSSNQNTAFNYPSVIFNNLFFEILIPPVFFNQKQLKKVCLYKAYFSYNDTRFLFPLQLIDTR